jgi:hypothetical protein
LNYPINFCFNHGFSRDNEAGQANRLPFWSRIGVRGGGGILVEATPAWSSKAPLPGARGSFGWAQQGIGAAPAGCRTAKQTHYSRAAWLKSSQKPWQR